ncbi:DUF1801 domain-containing protein [Sphingomonas suaedae]|uniref:DUF1801 domain-containing protein n=1 Tax=Sphingomonas suaedae TaxID=2599297 RepID=A0A518RJF7_9SPHN|nr:DUF1801 domain-containing protein [Sphingomonas suaedae]QDX27572.1 DUF1801 domain-containing protein [Sphingomonas suaedae]
MSDAAAAYLAGLAPADRAMIDALRGVVIDAAPDLVEEIKWNASSFRNGADHKVTLGIERKGGVRIVLHRGVAKKDQAGWSFADPDRLAAWPAADRGVVTLRTLGDIVDRRDALGRLVARWIAATR